MDRFYVIPKFVMVEKGLLSSSNFKGKTSVRIAPPGYKHWTLEFIDKFPLLTTEKLDPLLGKSSFEKACIERKLEYKTSMPRMKSMMISSVEGKKVHFINCKRDKDEKEMYSVNFKREAVIDGKDTKMRRKYKDPSELKGKNGDAKRRLGIFEDSDDMDVFVVEVDKVPDKFCVIPKSVLVEKGYVKTDHQLGHEFLSVLAPDSTGEHWTKVYWNNFDVFK